MPGYANPQNLNRYSYVTNNPLRYTDPTGHMLDHGVNEGGGSLISKKYPCAGMQGLVRDICSRGPKQPKTMKEIAKDIDEFFGIGMVLETCSNPFSGCGPAMLVPIISSNTAQAIDWISNLYSAAKQFLDSAPKKPWLTPTVTPTPFVSPTPIFTPTLTSPSNTLINTTTPIPSLTVTPSATPVIPTQPTLTPTVILTPDYWAGP